MGNSSGTGASEVSLLLNWKPNGLHVPYYTAKARGYYEDAGLTITSIKPGEGSGFAAKQAGLGNVPLAISSSDQMLNINSRNLSPESVGVVMQKSPVVLFTARSIFGEQFSDVEQLAGARVGTGPGMVKIMTELLLKKKGVRSEVDLVETGYNTVQQLLAGKIDAAGGVFADAIAARAREYTVDTIPVAEMIPSYGHVIAANPEYAEANPDAVQSFLRATAHGAAWAQQNPKKSTGYLIEANGGLAESRAQQREKWETMSTQFMLSEAVRNHGWGWSKAEPWKTTAEALAGTELLDGDVDSDSVWTNEYLDTSSRYIGSYTDIVSK